MSMDTERKIRVLLAHASAARQAQEQELQLPSGSTLAQALVAGGMAAPGTDFNNLAYSVGIWGRKVTADVVLRDGDRVEIYRPLRVDPKVARRQRFAKQGARSAGLFAQRRPGAKAGY